MIGNTETTAAILARLFCGTTASMGTNWVDSVQVGMSDTCLHSLVVSNGTPSAAKTRDMDGHFRMKTQMKHMLGCYWKEAPIPFVSQDALKLNDPAIDTTACLHQICTDSIGGILLVTRLFDATGPIDGALITIVGAPSLVTYSADAADSGLILDDIWDENALGGFDPALVTSIPHCPVLTATEGYSRDTTLPMEVEHILLDA